MKNKKEQFSHDTSPGRATRIQKYDYWQVQTGLKKTNNETDEKNK